MSATLISTTISTSEIKVWDIPGGIHPAENKHQSLKTPIQQAPIPAELTFPLSQHIGAPAEAIVKVGEKVLKGQMIAKAAGFVSVPIHASTSGLVIAIENRAIPHSSGMTAPCIVIQSDGKDEWIAHSGIADYKTLSKPELIDIIRNAGIAGMGGAGFPTAVKLNTRPDQIIETLILNATECEPYITADDILMRERADKIIQGTLILQHIVKPSKQILIGIEDNKPEAIAAMKKAAQGTDIKIAVFPTKYPSGGEKQLIQILTGKQVPNGKLPGDIGIVCQNIGTAVAIYNAVVLGEPLISRITTVTGNAVSKQQNYEVLLGSPMRTLLDVSGYEAKKASRLIMGGPMMGFALPSQDIPIVKTTNCLLAPTEQELPSPTPAQACIRCGMCAEACPVSLLPQQMYWFAQSKNYESLQKHHLFDCIECGACSYACPSNIPLVQYYRASKADIRQVEADKKKSDYSKERFESRVNRLEKMELDKEAKRLERQNKAAANASIVPDTSIAPSAPSAPVSNAVIDSEAKTMEINAITEKDLAAAVASSLDPVQAAIERAKAKAAGNAAPVDPVAEAKSKVDALVIRVKKAQEKLTTAESEGSDIVDALKSSLEKLQEKLDAAQQELNRLNQ